MQDSNLEVYSLGRFLVRKDEEIISDLTSRAEKLWVLFQYLLSHPGEIIPPAQIIDDLDFDMELVDSRNALENRIYRLRKLLASHENYSPGKYIEFAGGGYRLNWEGGGWYDIREFISGCRRAEKLTQSNAPEKAREAYSRALDLYQGDYLNSRYNLPWVVTKRVQYRQIYLEAVIAAANLLIQEQDYQEVEKMLYRALQIEPFEEELHQLYVDAMLEQGKTNKARRYYSYLEALLAQKGVEPFPEVDWESYSAGAGGDEKVEKTSSRPDEVEDIVEEFSGSQEEDDICILNHETFREIVLLQKKQVQRRKDKKQIYLASIIMDFKRGNTSNGDQEKYINCLQRAFNSCLRRSDALCCWKDGHYLLLLIEVEEPQVEKILSRIKNWVISCDEAKSFTVNTSYSRI